MTYLNVLLFNVIFTTHNQRLLVFLLAKAPKGTKNSLAPASKADP
jgi:hypothetical protein